MIDLQRALLKDELKKNEKQIFFRKNGFWEPKLLRFEVETILHKMTKMHKMIFTSLFSSCKANKYINLSIDGEIIFFIISENSNIIITIIILFEVSERQTR